MRISQVQTDGLTKTLRVRLILQNMAQEKVQGRVIKVQCFAEPGNQVSIEYRDRPFHGKGDRAKTNPERFLRAQPVVNIAVEHELGNRTGGLPVELGQPQIAQEPPELGRMGLLGISATILIPQDVGQGGLDGFICTPGEHSRRIEAGRADVQVVLQRKWPDLAQVEISRSESAPDWMPHDPMISHEAMQRGQFTLGIVAHVDRLRWTARSTQSKHVGSWFT